MTSPNEPLPEPYKPAEDTFLLEDAIASLGYAGEIAVEVGCGEGYLTSKLLEHSEEVIGIDIHIYPLLTAWNKLTENRNRTHLIQGDTLSCLRSTGRIGVIIANPPYLPNDEELNDPTIHGGETGVEVILKIVEQALNVMKRGINLLIIASSLSDLGKLSKYNVNTRVIATKRLFFETLYCLNIFATTGANKR